MTFLIQIQKCRPLTWSLFRKGFCKRRLTAAALMDAFHGSELAPSFRLTVCDPMSHSQKPRNHHCTTPKFAHDRRLGLERNQARCNARGQRSIGGAQLLCYCLFALYGVKHLPYKEVNLSGVGIPVGVCLSLIDGFKFQTTTQKSLLPAL